MCPASLLLSGGMGHHSSGSLILPPVTSARVNGEGERVQAAAPHLPLSSSSMRDSSWRRMRKEEGTTPEEEPLCTASFRIVTCSGNLILRSGAEVVFCWGAA